MVQTKSKSNQRICCCCYCCRRDVKGPKAIYSTNLEIPVAPSRIEVKCNQDPKQKVEIPKCCRPECVCPPKQPRFRKHAAQDGDYIPLTSGSKEYHQSEIACHYKGEKYQNIINKLKIYLDQLDDRPCISEKPKPESKKPLMIYPGYIDKKHPSNSPPCNKMPHVVRRGRIRPTDDESYRETQYVDCCNTEVSRKKSKEIVGGVVVKGCECIKRNGLQDQCPRVECGRKPKCVSTNPGPCCEPALAVMRTIENFDEIRRLRKLEKWMEQNPKDAKIFKEGSDKFLTTSSLEDCYCCCCNC